MLKIKCNAINVLDDGFESVVISDSAGVYSDYIKIEVGDSLPCRVELGDILTVDKFGQFEVQEKSKADGFISITANGLGRKQESKTIRYKKATLSSVCKELADEMNLKLKTANSALSCQCRTFYRMHQTALEFASKLCSHYGYGLRVVHDCLIVYEVDKPHLGNLEVVEIDLSECLSISTRETLTKSYDVVSVGYECKDADKTIYIKRGRGGRLFTHKQIMASREEAEGKAASLLALSKSNKKTAQVDLPIDLNLCAGQSVKLEGEVYIVNHAGHKIEYSMGSDSEQMTGITSLSCASI